MAYITPNSTVRFHQNIPLDNTYDHTLYFSSLSEQETYFSYINQNNPSQSRVKYQIDNYTYQRHTRDSIRVGLPIENIINCSYMSFKNTSFENKWFYAFITNMEYVNNNTTIVYYEIDVMQTYVINDATFDQCYIERQHTVSDEIGENTIEEKVSIGDYVFENAISYNQNNQLVGGVDPSYTDFSIVVAASFDAQYDGTNWTFDTHSSGGLYGGCYSGLYLHVFAAYNNKPTGATLPGILEAGGINDFLTHVSEVANLPDGIVNIFMIPTVFTQLYFNTYPSSWVTQIVKYYNWTYGNNQAVKNNKLFTAPYTLLHIDNGEGITEDFPFEYFSTNYAEFVNQGIAMPTSEIHLVPRYYKGVIDNFNEKIDINNYPQCAFTVDSYKAWLAINSSKMQLEAGAAITRGIAGFVGIASNSGGAAGAIQGAVSAAETVGNMLIENKLASTKPPHNRGQNTGILNVSNKQFGFHFYYARPKDEYARIIDDYFTRYGYAIHQNAVPNLCARTRFTYIKTVDCTINANMPNEYSQKIVSIMNNGITFWNDKQHIGNYEIANEVWPG